MIAFISCVSAFKLASFVSHPRSDIHRDMLLVHVGVKEKQRSNLERAQGRLWSVLPAVQSALSATSAYKAPRRGRGKATLPPHSLPRRLGLSSSLLSVCVVCDLRIKKVRSRERS